MGTKNLKEVVEKCITNWNYLNDDTRVTSFLDKIDSWINQFPDEYHEYIYTLITNLKYYTKRIVNKTLYEIHQVIISKGVSENDTVYSFIKSSDGISNSSNDYWTEYKNINNLNRNLCYEDLRSITDQQWEYINNIVFIDDFVGTGCSFIKFMNKLGINFINKKIYIVSVHLMNEAEQLLNQYALDKGFTIELVSGFSQKKAFSSNFFEDDSFVKGKIIEVSSMVGISNNSYMGFKNSESLVSFFNNTPNNTLGIFWEDNSEYKSIFPRIMDKRPTWQNMRKNSKNKKTENYNNRRKLND